MSNTLAKIHARIQNLDTILFAREDEEKDGTVGKAVGGVATGAGIVGGGYLAGRGIQKARTVGLLGPGEISPGSPRSIMGRVASSGATYGGTATQGVGSGVRSAAKGAAQAVGNVARQTGVRAGQVFRRITGAIGRAGRSRVQFSANTTSRVIALAAKAEAGIVEFKEAELTPADHLMRHYYGPVGTAMTSRKGKKMQALKESGADYGKNVGGGALIGTGLGMTAGSAVLAHNVAKGGIGRAAKVGLLKEAAGGGRFRRAAALGGAIGAGAGFVAGSYRGVHGKKQREIQARYK